MASTPEKDFQNDLEAIRVDVKALSDTVGNLHRRSVEGASGDGQDHKEGGEKCRRRC